MRRIRAYIINFQVFWQKINISSSTFTVPKGVKKIDVFCVGGGGHGVGANFSDWFGGAGGGYTATKLGVDVNPGDVIAVTVGNGGGGTSSVGSICSAAGGNSGWKIGGSGGSGGGSYRFGIGGKDGGDGGTTSSYFPGIGQHTTTRYFGESTGTLYSTGGNSADSYDAPRYDNYIAPQPNTGDGGHKGSRNAGGSGICIIRWGGQKS